MAKHLPNSKRHNQGKFMPKNPDKYIGETKNILFRSSWELHVMQFLDKNPNVVRWASEEIAIEYSIKTIHGMKKKRYLPDFFVEFVDKFGNFRREVWEIKPKADMIYGKTNKSKITAHINKLKWEAAIRFCNANGWKFRLLTEDQLFGR